MCALVNTFMYTYPKKNKWAAHWLTNKTFLRGTINLNPGRGFFILHLMAKKAGKSYSFQKNDCYIFSPHNQ